MSSEVKPSFLKIKSRSSCGTVLQVIEMEGQFWSSLRSDLVSSTQQLSQQAPPSLAMPPAASLNPYQHRYLQASWNAYTAQSQDEHDSKSWHDHPSAQANSFYNSSSGAGAAPPTIKSVRDVDELRSIVEAQQAVLAGLRAQQQADGTAMGRMSHAVHELCSRWSVMEAWQQEEAEPRLVASTAAVARFSHRLDDVQTSLLDKPGRTELSASAAAAVNPLAVQVASLRQSLTAVLDNSNLNLSKANSSSGADSPKSVVLGKEEIEAAVEAAVAARFRPAVEAAVASALLSSRETPPQALSQLPLPPPPNQDGSEGIRKERTASNEDGNDGAAATTQQSLEIAVSRAEVAAHKASESAAAAERSMHEYWTRMQAFVIAQLEDFEMKQRKAIDDHNQQMPRPLSSPPLPQQQGEAMAETVSSAEAMKEAGTATGPAEGMAATDTGSKPAEAEPTAKDDSKTMTTLESAATEQHTALASRVTEIESSLKVLMKSQSDLATSLDKDDNDSLPPFTSSQLDILRDIAQEAGATAAMAEGTRLQRRMADAVEACRMSCQSDAKKALEKAREEMQAFMEEEIRAAAVKKEASARTEEVGGAIASATRAARAEARAEVASQMATMVEEAEVTRTALKREVAADAISEAGRTSRRCVEEAEGRIFSKVSAIATEAGTNAAKVAIAQSLPLSSLAPSRTIGTSSSSQSSAAAPVDKGDTVVDVASEDTSGSGHGSSSGLSSAGVVEVAQELRRLLAPDLAALRADSMNSPQSSSSPSPANARLVLSSPLQPPSPLPSQQPGGETPSGLVGLTVENDQAAVLKEDQSVALHDSPSDSFEEVDHSAVPKDDQSADICSPPNTPPNGPIAPSSQYDSFDEEEAEDSMSLSMSASHDLSTLNRFSDSKNAPAAAAAASPEASTPSTQGLQHDRHNNNTSDNTSTSHGRDDKGEGSEMAESLSGVQPGSGLRDLLRASHRVNSNCSSRSSGSRNSSNSSSHRRHRRSSPRTSSGEVNHKGDHDVHNDNNLANDSTNDAFESPRKLPSSVGDKIGGQHRPSPPPMSSVPPLARGLPSSLAPLPSLVKSPLPSLGLPDRNGAEVGDKLDEMKSESNKEPTPRRHHRRHHTPSRLSPSKSPTLGHSVDSPNDASVSCDQDTSGTSVSFDHKADDILVADDEAFEVNAANDPTTRANAANMNTECNKGTLSDTLANTDNPPTVTDANIDTLSTVTNDRTLSTSSNTESLSTSAANTGTQSTATGGNAESIADTLSTTADAGTLAPVPSASQSSSIEPTSHDDVTPSESLRGGYSPSEKVQQPSLDHAPIDELSAKASTEVPMTKGMSSSSTDEANEHADKQNLSMDDSDDDDDVSFDDDDDDNDDADDNNNIDGAWHPDEALHWKHEELVAYLRNAPTPLGPSVADLFQAEVVDGKTLALMLPSDLSNPPPEGFGLDPTGPAFKELWRLAQELKASLQRENSE